MLVFITSSWFVVGVRYETTAAARWALLFIVRAFFNDTITVTVWTGFHVPSWGCYPSPAIISAGASLIRLLRRVGDMFTPESGHVQCNSACPLCANSGHC